MAQQLAIGQDQQWLEAVWQKLQVKVAAEAARNDTGIPYIPENGRYIDMGEKNLSWWTNGFWSGILWQMYHATGEETYKKAAEGNEERLDEALANFTGLHHDVGFMWLHTAVANYRLTGSERSRIRGLHAATILAGRYNMLGGFIRAWNGEGEHARTGWMIIDCMMNIPLLYWATEQTGDPRFKAVAESHADTTLKIALRADGSSNHIVVVDPANGDVLDTPAGQGFASGSSWSRGQAWALYGMALSCRHTGKAEYLDAAKRIAHYFIANAASTGYIPAVDFRAPAEPVWYDTTAGVIAACGLLEIAGFVGEYEQPLYHNAALNILRATEAKYANWKPEEDGIIGGGTESYHSGKKESPIIYGDYFFIEAVLRLQGTSAHLW